MSDNQQFCLRWNNHQSTLVQVIDSLLSSGVLVDCTLAAEGQYLHAHKVVLCACSPYLETLLSQHYEKHPIVILKDVKFQELKSMMDYMYKGEVNISQDQLGQFLKAAESLQIKGLTDGGGGENDSRDVGSTSQKRHEPAPVRKTIPHNQSRSPVVLPSHTSGLTIEPTKRTLPTHLSESQPDSPIRSREGSTSPTPRKRRRPRRLSQGEDDGHADNSCDLPMQPQSMSISSVPSSIPPLPSGSSSTITKAPPPDEDSENPESDRLSGLPEGLIKEKIEPQSEMLIEPKTEYMDETNNDDSVEDLTLDDDDDYDGMMEAGAGPSHGGNNPNENYATWQQITGDRQDDAYLNPADTGHRDSQDEAESASESDELISEDGSSEEQLPEEEPLEEESREEEPLEGELLEEKPFKEELLEVEFHEEEHVSIRDKVDSPPAKRTRKSVRYADMVESEKPEKPKNSKKRFTPVQVETLKCMFKESPYITQSQAATIARQTGLKKLQVRKWFSDYRCKIKRQSITSDRSSTANAVDSPKVKIDYVPKKRILARFESDQKQTSGDNLEATEEFQIISSPHSMKPITVIFGKRGGRKKIKKRNNTAGSNIESEMTAKRKKNVPAVETESRTVKRFTPSQVDVLKKTYAKSKYISQREAAMIARNIGLKKRQVRKWFCDYRCKMKKLHPQTFCNVDTSDFKTLRLPKKQQDQRSVYDELVDRVSDSDERHANGVIEEKRPSGRRNKGSHQKRTFRFTQAQLKVLNEEFEKSQFLNEEKLGYLCTKLDERRERIQTWFKMRRYKVRQSEQKFWQNIIDKSV